METKERNRVKIISKSVVQVSYQFLRFLWLSVRRRAPASGAPRRAVERSVGFLAVWGGRWTTVNQFFPTLALILDYGLMLPRHFVRISSVWGVGRWGLLAGGGDRNVKAARY